MKQILERQRNTPCKAEFMEIRRTDGRVLTVDYYDINKRKINHTFATSCLMTEEVFEKMTKAPKEPTGKDAPDPHDRKQAAKDRSMPMNGRDLHNAEDEVIEDLDDIEEYGSDGRADDDYFEVDPKSKKAAKPKPKQGIHEAVQIDSDDIFRMADIAIAAKATGDEQITDLVIGTLSKDGQSQYTGDEVLKALTTVEDAGIRDEFLNALISGDQELEADGAEFDDMPELGDEMPVDDMPPSPEGEAPTVDKFMDAPEDMERMPN